MVGPVGTCLGCLAGICGVAYAYQEEAKALGHTIASQLGPEHTAAALTSSLRLEGHDDPQAMQELQPFLHFRLLLLIYKRPGAFPSPAAFQDRAQA